MNSGSPYSPSESREILTVREVAEYLQLSRATVYRMAQNYRIPAIKIGRAWRFKREDIDKWLSDQLYRPD